MHGSQSAQNPSILPSNLLDRLTRGHKICVISAQIEFLGGTPSRPRPRKVRDHIRPGAQAAKKGSGFTAKSLTLREIDNMI